jgi:diguanylate cyclase (GGDEF)-like protein
MKIDWSAYKITLLLYFGVILLPISFYYSYSSFSEIQSDTSMLNDLTINGGSILSVNNTMDYSKKQKTIKNIDIVFKRLRPWIVENDGNKFYVGSEPLLQKYDLLLSNWQDAKISDKKMLLLCWKQVKSLVFSLNNMINLKQEQMYNIFYINLFGAMALLLILVSLTRAYIYKQLSKQALFDFKTKLYTRDYLLSIIEEMIALQTRNKDSLTVLYIDIEDLKSYKKSSQDKEDMILKHIGISLLKSVRTSDIACRYSQSEFIVVLPNTKSQNVEKVISHINKNLSYAEYKTKVIEHLQDETYDDFIAKFNKI